MFVIMPDELSGAYRVEKTVFFAAPCRQVLSLNEVFAPHDFGEFSKMHYGNEKVEDAHDGAQAPAHSVWRRMASDDATDAGALALAVARAGRINAFFFCSPGLTDLPSSSLRESVGLWSGPYPLLPVWRARSPLPQPMTLV
jgi:hypothetical protein